MLDQNALAIAARPPDIDTRTQNPSSRGLSRRSHGRRRCIYPAPFPWWILVAPGVAGTTRGISCDTASASSLTASRPNTAGKCPAGNKK